MKLLIWIAVLLLGVILGTAMSIFIDIRLAMVCMVVIYCVGFAIAKKICDNMDGGEFKDMEKSKRLQSILEKSVTTETGNSNTFTFKDAVYDKKIFAKELGLLCHKVNKKKIKVAKEGYEKTTKIIYENSNGKVENAYYELYKAIIEAYDLVIDWDGISDWENHVDNKYLGK